MKNCPNDLPSNIMLPIQQLANTWLASEYCPEISDDILRHWDQLIEEWILSEELPLIVRSGKSPSGSVSVHNSGREIIASDNSPASWAITIAERGSSITLQEIKNLLKEDQIPFSFAVSAKDKAETTYFCNLSKLKDNPNARNYKVAHIDKVGFSKRGHFVDFQIDEIISHFRRFMSPRNIFLVPKPLAGLAEIDEFAECFRREH